MSLKSFKEKLKNEKYLEDEIITIMTSLDKNPILMEKKFIHLAFHKMKKECELLQIKNLEFDTSFKFPYSKELHDILDVLEYDGTLIYYLYMDKITSILEKRDFYFNEKQKKEIDNCSNILQKTLYKD